MRLSRPTSALGLVVLGTALAGMIASCATSSATSNARSAPSTRTVSTTHAAASSSTIDRETAVAQSRYDIEATGAAVRAQMTRVAHDPALLRALSRNDLKTVRAQVHHLQLVPHSAHVAHIKILRGGRSIADSGCTFCIGYSEQALKAGSTTQTLQVSIQDVIGYIRYMHRHHPVHIVVRGSGAGHALSSLPAAKTASLPAGGSTTVGGHRYQVRSFTRPTFNGETLRIYVLA